jgi:hypothetical protein
LTELTAQAVIKIIQTGYIRSVSIGTGERHIDNPAKTGSMGERVFWQLQECPRQTTAQ